MMTMRGNSDFRSKVGLYVIIAIFSFTIGFLVAPQNSTPPKESTETTLYSPEKRTCSTGEGSSCFQQTKQWVFGLGTGKCGTHVLAALLNAQQLSSVTHEAGGCSLIPYEPEKSLDSRINKKPRQELISMHLTKIFGYERVKNTAFIGDVSLYYLPWVEDIMKEKPTAKFIAVQRQRHDTIESWMKWVPKTNHWISDPKAHGFMPLAEWDRCYPKYEIPNRRRAIELWYDSYYKEVDRLIAAHPDNVIKIQMETFAVNTTMQDNVMKWLGMCGPFARVDTDHPQGQNVRGFSVLKPRPDHQTQKHKKKD